MTLLKHIQDAMAAQMTQPRTLDEAKKAWETAREEARRNPTVENREATIAAWNAKEAIAPRTKRSGYASRAGQRQARERRR